jgi:hypothetical protein
MAEVTLDTLHNDLMSMRTELHIDIIRLEAKIDSKPSLMTMFTGIIVVVFGMASVIGVAISVLAALHMFK